jgi:hypothetical protein
MVMGHFALGFRHLLFVMFSTQSTGGISWGNSFGVKP